jgi:hypothetical protein
MRVLAWISDPSVLRALNGWLTIFFVVLIAPAFIFDWVADVRFVSILSLWALVASHWAGWQASRVEVKMDEAAD